MRSSMKTLLCAASLVAVAACTEGSRQEFYSEAGAEVDEGGFGNPTMQNMMAQMCRGQAKGHIVLEPIVVLDPARSTPSAPVYRRSYVRCSGELNGKYAQVIFTEYVASARERTTVTEANAGE